MNQPVESAVLGSDAVRYATCAVCSRYSIWQGVIEDFEFETKSGTKTERGIDPNRSVMVFPSWREGPDPHPDLPDSVRTVFEEARAVLPYSKRAAAALARVTLEGLCKSLGALDDAQYENEQGKIIHARSLAEKITWLYHKKELSAPLFRAAHTSRVSTNQGAHAGDIEQFQDDESREIALEALFYVNEITEALVALPAKLKARADQFDPNGTKIPPVPGNRDYPSPTE